MMSVSLSRCPHEISTIVSSLKFIKTPPIVSLARILAMWKTPFVAW
jgi:hypothetical protein